MEFSIKAYKAIAATILILLLLPAFASASSVCPSGCDHTSIESALNASTPGEIISIRGMTYHGSLNITKRVTLMGQGRTVMDAGGRKFAIALLTDGIRLEGLSVVNSSGTGIEVVSSDNAILVCDVRQNAIGVEMLGSRNILFGNSVLRNGAGITLSRSSGNSIAYSNISINRQYGLQLTGADNNIIRGNALFSNGLGISLKGSDNNLLYQNSLVNGDNAYDDGENRWDNGTTGNYYSSRAAPSSTYPVPGGSNLDRHIMASVPVFAVSEVALTPKEAYNLTREDGSIAIIDIRTPEEYRCGYIRGAVNLDFYSSDFNDRLRSLERNKRYLIYCRAGIRGRIAQEMMRALGFDEVYNLSGGIFGWESEGYPVEKGK